MSQNFVYVLLHYQITNKVFSREILCDYSAKNVVTIFDEKVSDRKSSINKKISIFLLIELFIAK